MSIEKLQSHYGFTRPPFDRGIPVQALHRHRAHLEAVARIRWLITTRGLGLLTGEVGAGKTVAVRAALDSLDASRHMIIYMANPAVGARGIHGAVVTALGQPPRFHHATLIPQVADVLAAESGERGRSVILIIDEAHLLTADQLEAVRMLTNADLDASSPLTCLLIGQPTLRRRLKYGDMAALDQRITTRYAMPGLDPGETKVYINAHLSFAGRADTLFSDDAVAVIHDASRGLPRAINVLGTQALVAAYATGKAIVDESSARAAVVEVTAE